MSPNAIFLYEIDESFGPNIIAEYYLSNIKLSQEILKEFIEKHVEKELVDATVKKNDIRYYSSKIDAKSIGKDNLYLGFILLENEDLISLKSIFEKSEEKIIENFSDNRRSMTNLLKDHLSSILSLLEKLKEPKLIIETINEKTKKMLDNGNLKEARELIELGEKIPLKLAQEIQLADKYFRENDFKKAKKSFEKAAELAALIQEDEIVAFLQNKGEKVGTFPDLLKEREAYLKEVKRAFTELTVSAQLKKSYEVVLPAIERVAYISNLVEDDNLLKLFNELMEDTKEAYKLATKLYDLNENLKNLGSKI
ncbi:MAG: hypothetical protein ACFFBP_01305 [Promethearchaeota archaeon]